MGWRVAESLLKLRSQVNAAVPNRNKDWDGTIGDEAHSARESDHNPDDDGVVKAMDLTHDPSHGFDSYKFADWLVTKAKDSRIKYVISNHRIASGTGQSNPAWVWRPYTGSNPHDHHVHISVKPDPAYYDDRSTWNISGFFGHPEPLPPVVAGPVLQLYQGPEVVRLQTSLGRWGARIAVDGVFGPSTDAAVRAFQTSQGLAPDGIVGPATWRALGG